MDMQRRQQLRRITELSINMLELARKLEWQNVAELEVERRDLVMQCFAQPTSEQDAPEVAASIKQILKLNQEIEALGQECRERLGGEIRMHNVGRAATAAYRSAAR
jgi:hypothetical protein